VCCVSPFSDVPGAVQSVALLWRSMRSVRPLWVGQEGEEIVDVWNRLLFVTLCLQ